MAIKFQYNKTSLGELGKQLKMRQKALPTIKSKELPRVIFSNVQKHIFFMQMHETKR